MRGTWAVGLLLMFGGLACDTEPPPLLGQSDAGTTVDAGAAADAGALDGATNGTDGGTNGPDSGVMPTPDAGTVVDNCDPVNQTGCDTPPNTKCVIEGGNPGAECVPPSPNDVGLGEVCDGQACEAGFVCLRQSQTSTIGACRKACDLTTGDGCETLGMEYECRTQISGTNWGACTELPPLCDPYTQAPCEQAQACQPFLRRTGTWELRCRTAGEGAEGAPCGGAARCQRGLACVSDTSGNAACRKYCELNDDCTAPAMCTGTVPEPPFMFCDG